MPLNLLFPDSRSARLDIEREVVGPDTVLENPHKASFDEIGAAAWAACDGIIVNRIAIRAASLSLLERCRVIVRNGVGFDVIDLEACGAAGIAVCNVPDYCVTEVADSAIGMMLAFARGTAVLNAALRADLKEGWTYTRSVTTRRLAGAGFGVIGLGRIGTAAALRAKALGMQVAFYDPHLPSGTETALGLGRARTLAELLADSDVISIHAPLTPQTQGMIDAAAVAAMKPGAYLINTARGPICDTAALLEGLKSGRLMAVGLDVLPNEPAGLSDPLVAAWHTDEPWVRGRVLLNPHAAFFSPVALTDLRRKAAQIAYFYLRDGVLTNCVNAEHLAKDAVAKRKGA